MMEPIRHNNVKSLRFDLDYSTLRVNNSKSEVSRQNFGRKTKQYSQKLVE